MSAGGGNPGGLFGRLGGPMGAATQPGVGYSAPQTTSPYQSSFNSQQAPQQMSQMSMSPLVQQQMMRQQQPSFGGQLGGQMGGIRPMGAPSGFNPFSQERMAALRQDPQFLEMQRVSGGGYDPQGGAVDGLGNPIKQYSPQQQFQQNTGLSGLQAAMMQMMANRNRPR